MLTVPEPIRTIVPNKGPSISIVAAMTTDYVIGIANKLPWKLSMDLKRFRDLTLNHTVIMGRKTWDSIGRPLPKRRNVVVTRAGISLPSGCRSVASLDEAIRICQPDEQIFVIGGGELYRLALPLATKLHLTLIETHELKLPLFTPFEGDAYFPPIPPFEWAIERLGRRNVARPKGRPAPIPFRSVYFRFVDLVRIHAPSAEPYKEPSSGARFDLNVFEKRRRARGTRRADPISA